MESVLPEPPQTVVRSRVRAYLAAGSECPVQCWPMEGAHTSTLDTPFELEELEELNEPPAINIAKNMKNY